MLFKIFKFMIIVENSDIPKVGNESKIGKKKLQKLQAKAEAKAQRESVNFLNKNFYYKFLGIRTT